MMGQVMQLNGQILLNANSQFTEWEPRIKLKALRNMLSDNAASWLQNLQIDDDATDEEQYQILREEFLTEFGLSPAQIFQLRVSLQKHYK